MQSSNLTDRDSKLAQLYVLAFPEAYPNWPWQYAVMLLLFMGLQTFTGFMAYLDEFVDLSKIES